MSAMNLSQRSAIVKDSAARLGFDYCGIAKAEFLEEEAPKLTEWLNRGYHGKMGYMENHMDKRLDPTKLVPGARSVVSLIYNYFPEEDLNGGEGGYKVAKYAYGKDYHDVIRPKLKELLQKIKDRIGEVDGRVFVDSGPVMERQWAAKSGLGWTGKNTLLLNRDMGSFFFLAELIIDLELEYDGPIKDYCGTCTRCMDACPTDAFPAPYVLDASKCISYLTIELKDEISKEFDGKMEDWIFGCDICQDVCPWNKFSKPHREPAFNTSDGLSQITTRDNWEEITEELFHHRFKDSAMMRTKYSGIKRNVAFVSRKDQIGK